MTTQDNLSGISHIEHVVMGDVLRCIVRIRMTSLLDVVKIGVSVKTARHARSRLLCLFQSLGQFRFKTSFVFKHHLGYLLLTSMVTIQIVYIIYESIVAYQCSNIVYCSSGAASGIRSL